MKIGWIGLGKLGLPCALAMEDMSSHEIMGYDVDAAVHLAVESRVTPRRQEEGLGALLSKTKLQLGASMDDVIQFTDELIFVAVQTPHHPDYGGERLMPMQPVDFDYAALRDAAMEINAAAEVQQKSVIMVVISTALPGTMEREIVPLLGRFVDLIYNPFFIAMGTTIRDFYDPEFVLIGTQENDLASRLIGFYDDLYECSVPIMPMTLAEAELTKVAYNTYISMKIVFANTLLEMSDKLGTDVDTITNALGKADRRLVSTMYMSGGVGDGGACHPRDNIAMSWLASKLDLSVDPFEFVTRARERQSEWLVDYALNEAAIHVLPIVVLGKAYKPNSDLMYGSPASLFVNQVLNRNSRVATWWDPFLDKSPAPAIKAVYVVMTKHDVFEEYQFPRGSIVIDPHRYIMPQADVRMLHLGGGA